MATNPTTVYHARLYAMRGFLSVIDRALTFLDAATGETHLIAGPDVNWLTTTGPLADAAHAARLRAEMRGCHEHLACTMGG